MRRLSRPHSTAKAGAYEFGVYDGLGSGDVQPTGVAKRREAAVGTVGEG